MYPQIVTVNILISYEDIYKSQNQSILFAILKHFYEWHVSRFSIANDILTKIGVYFRFWAHWWKVNNI